MKLGTNIPVISPVQPIELPPETATLVNISETTFYAERTYGCFRIEGRKPGEAYAKLIVAPRRGMIDLGDNSWSKPLGKNIPDLKNVQQFVIKAEDIGMDLVHQWNSDIWGIGSTATGEIASEVVRGFAGVFVADGPEPTEEELEQAKTLLAASDQALTERAHAEWDQFHSPQTIHAGWKRAARRLGIDAEWLYTVSNQAALPDCPHCGSKLKTATAKVCATCHRDVVSPANGQERHLAAAIVSPEGKPRGRKKAAA